MIGTHSAKLFNARIKQESVCADIIAPVPRGLICSQTIVAEKKYWALPRSAADMKKYREISATATNADTHLPPLEEAKQLLLPLKNWKDDGYLNASPVASCALISEMWKSSFDEEHKKTIPTLKTWRIQKNPAAFANHGETLLIQSGRIKCFRRGVSVGVKKSTWAGDYVMLKGTANGVNVAPGGLAIGFPSITAIGGYVHTIERAIGADLQFAVGFTRIYVSRGFPLGLRQERKVQDRTMKVIVSDEIKATCEFVLLIKSTEHDETVLSELSKINRLAGGSVFSIDAEIRRNSTAPIAAYLADFSYRIDSEDSLNAAIKYFMFDGEWREGKNGKKFWYQENKRYTAVQNGYAFLEEPDIRSGARNPKYRHVWAEPTFCVIQQRAMHEKCWWKRVNTDAGVFWVSAEY